MAKAKDSNSKVLNTGGVKKRKGIKSMKARGLAFPEMVSGTPAPPKVAKGKKKAPIIVDSSVEGSNCEEEDEDEDLKIE
jgi:hypothetical protein